MAPTGEVSSQPFWNKTAAKRLTFALAVGFVLVSVLTGTLAAVLPVRYVGMAVGSLVIAGVGAYIISRPIRVLYAYIGFLPFHVLIMSILLGTIGLSVKQVRIIAAWKEVLAIGTAGSVAMTAFLRGKIKLRLILPDIFALILLLLNTLYLILPPLHATDVSVIARLYGYRDLTIFILLYFLGRLVIVGEREINTLFRWLILIGVIISVVGIIERFFVPTVLHSEIGAREYYRDFLGVSYSQGRNEAMGLPYNYWIVVGGERIRRAVSVYMSSQPFATSFLVILPIATFSVYTKRWNLRGFALLCLYWAALLLSIVRMTIMVSVVLFLLISFLMKRYKTWIVAVLISGIFSLSLLLVYWDTISYLLSETFSPRQVSTAAHLDAWLRSLSFLGRNPLGWGLGSAGQVARRFGGIGSGGESQYFVFAGSTGLLGLLLYCMLLLSILWLLWSYRRVEKGLSGGLVMCMAVVTLGFAANEVTAALHGQLFVAYVFWWLAGMAIQQVSNSRHHKLVQTSVDIST